RRHTRFSRDWSSDVCSSDLSVRNQIDESMEQVLHTIIEAFVLVFIVVFVFLQNFRSTIIPAIAIPVSLIGTFFFLNMLGFSINKIGRASCSERVFISVVEG